MASEGIEHCELLTEVMAGIPPQYLQQGNAEISFPKPDDEKMVAWSGELVTLLNEVKQSPIEFSKKEFIDIYERVLALNAVTVELPQRFLIAQFADAALKVAGEVLPDWE